MAKLGAMFSISKLCLEVYLSTIYLYTLVNYLKFALDHIERQKFDTRETYALVPRIKKFS